MSDFHSHLRQFDLKRYVYQFKAGAEVAVQSTETEKRAAAYKVSAVDTKDSVWARLEEEHKPLVYETTIQKYVDRLFSESDGGHKKNLLNTSVKRYTFHYKQIEAEFMRSAETLQEAHNKARSDILDRAKSERATLRRALEAAKPLAKIPEKIPAAAEQDEVTEYFEDYSEALGSRYLNVHASFGQVMPKPLVPLVRLDKKARDAAGYREHARALQSAMEGWVERKMEALYKDDKKPSQKKLEDFKKELSGSYEYYATLGDKDASVIGVNDLIAIEEMAGLSLRDSKLEEGGAEAIQRVLEKETTKDTLHRLEAIYLMRPGQWHVMANIQAKQISKVAADNGSKGEFTKFVSTRFESASSFEEAQTIFEDRVNDSAAQGVMPTLNLLNAANQSINAKILRYEENMEPVSLKRQVGEQLDYLLSDTLRPDKPTDRALVEFMQAGQNERIAILKNDKQRELLFRGIALATVSYRELFDKRYSNIPDDATKLKRSPRIEKPTSHDQAAQLKALIILGDQAKVIAGNFDNRFVAQIEKTWTPEAKQVRLGLKFKSPAGKIPRYQPGVVRNGFNARDLGLKGVKVLGALMMVSNIAQSYSEASGDDFLDKLFNAVELSASNHAFLATAALTTGAHLAERNKKVLKYHKLSEYERDRVKTFFSLDNMGKRVGERNFQKFLANDAEWEAAKHPNMTGERVKELVKEAAKRTAPGSKPVIRPQDVEVITGIKEYRHTLTKGPKADRARYLFYAKFLTRKGQTDVDYLRELCSPEKTK